jgi:hypothetical protein
MQKKHRYEFERTKKEMALYVYLYIAYQVIVNVQTLIPYIMPLAFDAKVTEKDYCTNPSWHYVATLIFNWSTKFLGIQNILLVYLIVNLKSSDDILQGISKFDYLLKVSIF